MKDALGCTYDCVSYMRGVACSCADLDCRFTIRIWCIPVGAGLVALSEVGHPETMEEGRG